MAVVAASCAVLPACGLNDAYDFTPRPRLGALPFPGPLTLYVSTEVGELGDHHYVGMLERPLGTSDGARGIIYTCSAGFLDLAHLRESVDWTWWLYAHTRTLVRNGGTLAFQNDQTGFELIVRPSPALDALPRHERAAILDEAAIRLAQRGAVMVETWHEIESWYGLRTVFFIPEDRSTFTWDDSASHAVGIQIGARVAGVSRSEYDARAKAEIRAELESLHAVPKEWSDKAARMMSQRWWDGETPIRRDLDTGLTTGFKVPWLVPGLDYCKSPEPARLPVPSLRDVRGHDLSGIYELRLTPSTTIAQRMYAGRPVPPSIDAEREFPGLIEQLRTEIKARFGPDADKP